MKTLLTLFVSLLVFMHQSVADEAQDKITMHKQAGCMCCDKHGEILREQGFDVEYQIHDNLNFLKAELAIPRELAGCHTMVVGDYIVEGHVSGDIIARLLQEKPAIRGIALPGMPRGTPGMPGPR